MILTLNTSICSILDVGLYESNLMYGFDKINEMCEGNYPDSEDDRIDWDHATVRIADFKNSLKPYIFDTLSAIVTFEINPSLSKVANFIHVLEITDYYSPKYYNFAKDEVEFTIDLSVDTMQDLYRLCMEDAFDDFLNEFKSRDGFMSFTPSSRVSFEICMGNDPARCIGLMIQYLSADILSDYQQQFEDTICEQIDYREYVDEKEEVK